MLIRPVDYLRYSYGCDTSRCSRCRRHPTLRKLLVDRQTEALATARDDRSRSLGFSLTMFEHARDHRDHYREIVRG